MLAEIFIILDFSRTMPWRQSNYKTIVPRRRFPVLIIWLRQTVKTKEWRSRLDESCRNTMSQLQDLFLKVQGKITLLLMSFMSISSCYADIFVSVLLWMVQSCLLGRNSALKPSESIMISTLFMICVYLHICITCITSYSSMASVRNKCHNVPGTVSEDCYKNSLKRFEAEFEIHT